MQLTALFRKFRKGIAFALSLVVIENIAWIAEPTIFGIVIDAFINKGLKSLDPTLVIPLLVWIGVYLINSGVGALRRSFDQRIYLNIFTQIATGVARDGKEQGHSVSKIAARAELSREFITFLQYRLSEIIEQSISICGAVFALFFYDWRIALTCFFIVIPLIVITALYNKKVILHQKVLHDTREDAYDIFATQDIEAISRYYKNLSKSERKIANWGALNFGIIRLCLLFIFLIVLYISIDLDDFSTGNIYSIVAYLWTFVTSTEYLPELLESTTSLRDISRRLKTENGK